MYLSGYVFSEHILASHTYVYFTYLINTLRHYDKAKVYESGYRDVTIYYYGHFTAEEVDNDLDMPIEDRTR